MKINKQTTGFWLKFGQPSPPHAHYKPLAVIGIYFPFPHPFFGLINLI